VYDSNLGEKNIIYSLFLSFIIYYKRYENIHTQPKCMGKLVEGKISIVRELYFFFVLKFIFLYRVYKYAYSNITYFQQFLYISCASCGTEYYYFNKLSCTYHNFVSYKFDIEHSFFIIK
jgi:hypothetical protein